MLRYHLSFVKLSVFVTDVESYRALQTVWCNQKCTKSDYWQAATRAECRRSCGQWYTQVWPWLVATLTYWTTLAQYTGAGRVQARPHGVQLSAQPSTPVPRRPLPVCIQCRLQTTPSSCLAIVWAVTVGGLFLWPALRYGTGYQTVWETRPSAETPSDVHWRRFYFQLTCVHSALELSGRCALQIYLLTYLLT